MKVKDFLNSPEKWTTKVYARDEIGDGCAAESAHAVSWCLLGALLACGVQDNREAETKIGSAMRVLFPHERFSSLDEVLSRPDKFCNSNTNTDL